MKIQLNAQTDRRLWAFIRAVDTEIGGWGYAKLVGGDLHWEQVFLVPQEVNQSEVDFETTGGDAAAVERAINDGVLDDPAFVWVSWHSHHSMKAFWSNTDQKRIAALAKTGVQRLLSFVGCHDGSYQLRLDVFDVEAAGINLGQVTRSDLKLTRGDEDEFTEAIGDEIAANVKATKFLGMTSGPRAGTATKDGDERRLHVDEALAVRELIDNDFTYDEAIRMIDDIGVEGVDFLVDTGEPFGPDEMLPIGG
jgi:hypothetical protein